MRNKKIKDLAFCSILGAIIVVMVVTGIGYIPIGTFAYITILTIPVFIGAIFLGKWYGLALGTVFGLTSMIYSFVNPAGGINAPFTNPLLSVVPRAFLGFIIEPIFNKLENTFSNKKVKWLAIIFTVIICQLIHSISVITILYFVGKSGFFFFAKDYDYIVNGNLIVFIITGFGINGLLEIVAACLIVTPIYVALTHVVNKKELDLENEVDDKEDIE